MSHANTTSIQDLDALDCADIVTVIDNARTLTADRVLRIRQAVKALQAAIATDRDSEIVDLSIELHNRIGGWDDTKLDYGEMIPARRRASNIADRHRARLSINLIEYFIAQYEKEYDFYDRAGRMAARKLEADLQAAGIRSIVTSRAKSITRLEKKCRQRGLKCPYSSINKIFDDIVDLAGVRVALYFPAERDQVIGMINRSFVVRSQKEFPEKNRTRLDRRFSGYSALHYRVQLKEQDLAETDKRYSTVRIEVQVASVLMHAWSEVEHDLVYKPEEGELSEEEYALLDQLNGLVIAGEISLERLQKASEARVAESGRKIANHYDLAVHLLGRATKLTGEVISESGLGRVDLLFELLARLGIDTPELLGPYLEVLDDNVEARPLAEQVIDSLLAEDSSRNEIYNAIRTQ